MGFSVVPAWGGNYDCSIGPYMFRLQNYYVEDWANNFMMQFQVQDAAAWCDHARAVIDTGLFGDARVSPTESFDGALITHVVDPSGVLLIFIQ
jgi:hypothetical protein